MSETQSYKTVTFSANELQAVETGLILLMGNIQFLADHQEGKGRLSSLAHLMVARAALRVVRA